MYLSFRRHDENQFIFVDEVLVLVLVDEKNTGRKSPTIHCIIVGLLGLV